MCNSHALEFIKRRGSYVYEGAHLSPEGVSLTAHLDEMEAVGGFEGKGR